MADDSTTITERDNEQVARANASGKTPVVLVHGLWLLPSSWDRWAALFEDAGYAALTLTWPDDPDTVEEALAHPEVFAHKKVGMIADHIEGVIATLTSKPALVGHSIGGLLVQMLAGRGVAAAAVAIDPGPFRGVLPLPYHLIKATEPVWHNPANHHRAVPLTFEQFRYGFANAVDEEHARHLYKTFAVPASGAPIFQAASANLNPVTEAKVDVHNPERGPLLIISGDEDNTVPPSVAHAARRRPLRTRHPLGNSRLEDDPRLVCRRRQRRDHPAPGGAGNGRPGRRHHHRTPQLARGDDQPSQGGHGPHCQRGSELTKPGNGRGREPGAHLGRDRGARSSLLLLAPSDVTGAAAGRSYASRIPRRAKRWPPEPVIGPSRISSAYVDATMDVSIC